MKRENEGEKKRRGEEDGAVSDCSYNGGGVHFGKNFEIHFGEGCMRNMQCNIDVSTNSTFALEPAQENFWMIFDRRP